jgi:hypothetical protein
MCLIEALQGCSVVQSTGSHLLSLGAKGVRHGTLKTQTDRQTGRKFYYRHHLTSFECGPINKFIVGWSNLAPGSERKITGLRLGQGKCL